jgi:hypothetical protein
VGVYPDAPLAFLLHKVEEPLRYMRPHVAQRLMIGEYKRLRLERRYEKHYGENKWQFHGIFFGYL